MLSSYLACYKHLCESVSGEKVYFIDLRQTQHMELCKSATVSAYVLFERLFIADMKDRPLSTFQTISQAIIDVSKTSKTQRQNCSS